MRIQKSLILDFDPASAHDSAIEDWKIDIERELLEKQSNSVPQMPNFNRQLQNPKTDSEEGDKETDEKIQYERLSEFFFDLCLSWC